MHVKATKQMTNKVALVAGTRLVNFQSSAAILLSADFLAATDRTNRPAG